MKNFKINYIWFIKTIFLAVIAMFFSCNNQNTENKTSSKDEKSEKENFDNFYKRFYSDTIFQMSRITFPLDGILICSDRMNFDTITKKVLAETPYIWKKENWVCLKKDKEGTFTKETKSFSDTLKVITTNSTIFPASTIEKYKIINGKWYLVYFYLEAL
jgi:hypothetical protein